jgi:hypothetical protein
MSTKRKRKSSVLQVSISYASSRTSAQSYRSVFLMRAQEQVLMLHLLPKDLFKKKQGL